MEEVKRIYILLLHSNGLKIRDIARELDLDKYYVANILFSTDNIPFWYQNDDSLWFAKEGALQIEEQKQEQEQVFPVRRIASKSKREIYQVCESFNNKQAFIIKEIAHSFEFTEEYNIELIKRYREGDNKAYELLVKSKLGIVYYFARYYKNRGVCVEDLFQEGAIGLVTAIERFDYSLNSSFTEYAKYWISQAILNVLTSHPFMIKIPINQLSYHRKIHRAKEAYEAEYGYEPSANVLGEKSDMSPENYAYLFSLPDNLSDIVKYDDNLDEIIDENANTDKQLMSESQNYYINTLLNNLSNRGREIIKTYYGIDVKHEETLYNIGIEWGLTRERTRQIVNGGIKQLKDLAKGYVKKDITVFSPQRQNTLTEEKRIGFQMFLSDLRKNNININDVLCDIDNGVIKSFNGLFYRLRCTDSFCVHIIELDTFGKTATDLIIKANAGTPLYNSLTKRNWEESIQDIVKDQFSGEYRIKVENMWYNHMGEPLYSNITIIKKEKNKTDFNKMLSPLWTHEKERDLVAFYRAGMSYEQLARIFETSQVEIINKLAFTK